VELDFRSIKDVTQMDQLRCKTADMVPKEVAAHLPAYNLIRTVTARAADLAGVLPRRMSFKGGSARRETGIATVALNCQAHCASISTVTRT
jgi:hypothetical protein